MWLSVIIPFYNAEKFLADAIESAMEVCEQNQIEIVLVDDGSVDKSVDIATDYMQKYTNIKLYQQKNGGVSSARNLGLSKAKGRYIMFLDSDDILNKQLYSDILPYLKSGEYDVVFFGVDMIKHRQPKIETTLVEAITLTTQETISYFLNKKISGFNAGKIYKKQLFQENGILFPVGKIFEDLEVIYRLLPFTQKTLWMDRAYYYYYIANEGALTKSFSVSDISTYHKLNVEIFHMYLQSQGKQNASIVCYYFMDSLLFALSELYKLDSSNRAVKSCIQSVKYDIKKLEKEKVFRKKEYVIYTKNVMKYVAYKIGCLSILIKFKNRK